jgi:glycosyltransferase involved in cell wall biosynthesis
MGGVQFLIVAVDTLFLRQHLRYTGTATYLRHLLAECLKIAAGVSIDIQFHGFRAPGDKWAENGLLSPFLRVHEVGTLRHKRLWLLGGMALHTSLVRPDLVFLPTAHSSLPGPFFPLVSTILDTIPNRLPRELVDAGALVRHLTRTSAKLARKVITISQCSKRDLQEFYGLDPAKIEVTYLGYDKSVYNALPPDPQATSALLGRLGIRRPFVLHHGMVQLRKNIHRLIYAWNRVQEGCRDFDAQLVLAGPLGHGHEQILETRQTSPNCDRIIMTGPLLSTDLAMLIKAATLCVVPSLYEGFCLPMVEAMACGTPTVASNASCLPEISGDALEYFDPYSIEDMAERIRRALEQSELRLRLRDGGLARASQFSWERCARETLQVFATAHLA